MKRIKNILFLVGLIIYLIVVTGFISHKEKQIKISSLKIRIVDSTENQFIRSSDVKNMLEEKKFAVFGKPASMVNLREIENSLKSRQNISKAEAFITERGVIHIEIKQKTPFIRIYNRYGQGYYLDYEGNIILLASNFSPFILIANGYIAEPFRIGKTLNIFSVKYDSLKLAQKTIYDVYNLAKYISGDKFWQAQIEQIYVNNKYEFELIPRVGSHIIEIGSAEDLSEKFDKLSLLYHQGFNNLGWNKYERISLKYKNQIVCTKIQ
jgi:cell division protein FtsQ